VEDPETTRELNEVLHSVTRSSLVLLTLALVVVALARRRLRLAVAVGVAVTGAVATTEVLKLHILTRPPLDDIAGIVQNSFPSGHATIGLSLSLGLVMVTPQRWRWASAVTAILLRWRGGGDPRSARTGEVEERLDTRAAALAGGLVVVLALVALVTTSTADALTTVDVALDHLAVCVVILMVGVGEVIGYHQLLRGLSLDAPPPVNGA